MRKGFALKMQNKTKRPEARKIIKYMIALALLPVDKIPETYGKIKRQALEMFPKNPGLLKFLKYYEKVWMSEKSRYKPHDFRVHGQIHRTNNAVESYHAQLAKLFDKKPTPKKFCVS